MTWHGEAACVGLPEQLFFPARGEVEGAGGPYVKARRVCAGCAVRGECLDAALAEERHDRAIGFRGGLTPSEREAMARA